MEVSITPFCKHIHGITLLSVTKIELSEDEFNREAFCSKPIKSQGDVVAEDLSQVLNPLLCAAAS